MANSVVATVGAGAGAGLSLAHIYEFLTLLLGVPHRGFIAAGCQEDCKALSSIRTIWRSPSDRSGQVGSQKLK